MLKSTQVSISIARDWHAVYEAFWKPQTFGHWATGLSKAHLEPDGDVWVGQGQEGAIRVRFTPHNAFGIMDHWVDTGSGTTVYMPMRVIENGAGADVTLTVFRHPNMSDAKYQEDLFWVEHDLNALKKLAEALPASSS